MTNKKPYADGAAGAIGKIHAFEKFGSILGLERMNELMALLGNPQDKLKVLHVAGTNGKGSVCRYLYSVLQENGYRTGLYTSPFLEVFNERIELDGAYISDEDLTEYTDRVLKQVQRMVDAGKQSPTEFEVITAIALLYFYEKGADYVVLEVGLGGRGDSTNVCKAPLISVITSISYDHTDRLGDTLAKIAWEKSGIIKDGCPVVTSAKAPEALEVIERTAAEHHALFFETRRIPYKIKEQGLDGSCFDVDFQGVLFEDLRISMVGAHQIENAIAALAAINLLEERGEVRIQKDKLYSGLRKAKQIGRFEVLTAPDAKPVVIIDGAHNPDGAKVLRDAMKTFCPSQRILMVTGMLADKDGLYRHRACESAQHDEGSAQRRAASARRALSGALGAGGGCGGSAAPQRRLRCHPLCRISVSDRTDSRDAAGGGQVKPERGHLFFARASALTRRNARSGTRRREKNNEICDAYHERI